MPRGVLGNAFHWAVCACVPAGGGGLCATAPVRAAKVSELMLVLFVVVVVVVVAAAAAAACFFVSFYC